MHQGRTGIPDLPVGADPSLLTAVVALAEGRFASCDAALSRVDGADPRRRAAAALLGARLRREQGFPAEAEVLARGAAADHPGPAATALHAALLGDLGRDGAAGEVLEGLARRRFAALSDDPSWLVSAVALSELCATTAATIGAVAPSAPVLASLLVVHDGGFAADGSGWAGSVSRALGLLAWAAGDWDGAASHLEVALRDHERVGAPVLVAHTRRELAGVLRARCRPSAGGPEPDDWERAFDLVSSAESIYRRLGIDRMADDAQAVVARSTDAHAWPRGTSVLCRRRGRWWFGPAGAEKELLPDSDGVDTGLADLVTLLSRPGQRVHVAELAARTGRLGADGRAERDRMVAVRAEEARAERSGDRLVVALARAELDHLSAQPAVDRPARSGLDPLDRDRRSVVRRIRIGVDHLERVDGLLGRHLRHSVRLGTLCSYQPARPTTWRLR